MQRLPWLVFDNLLSEDLNKIFLNSNVQIKDDSALADGSGDPKYITVIDITNLGGTIATIAELLAATTQWLEIGSKERGGIAWSLDVDYLIGDLTTEDGDQYICTADHTSLTGDVVLGSPTQPTQTSWKILSSVITVTEHTATAGQTVFNVPAGFTQVLSVEVNGSALPPSEFSATSPDVTLVNPALLDYKVVISSLQNMAIVGTVAEIGGVLHNTGGINYKVGDTVTIFGDSFLYHCILAHTSAATCVGDTTNWSQPVVGYAPTEYNYTSDLLGTGNGPNDFAVALGSAGRTATVWLEGYEVRSDEYSTAVDGVVTILTAVSDNSWVKIVI